MLTRLRIWWVNWRRKVQRAASAYRDPLSVVVSVPTSSPSAINVGQSRFEVLRVVKGKPFALYDGPSGSEARRWFEHVAHHKEPGKMRFLHDGVCRGTYTGPDK